MEMAQRDDVMKALKKVIDPHTGIDLVEMGVIREVEVEGEKVRIHLKPTSPFCPITDYLVKAVRDKILELGYKEVEVYAVP